MDKKCMPRLISYNESAQKKSIASKDLEKGSGDIMNCNTQFV